MIRASGAMPKITALQIATASFAVPKSVIKTIVGLRGGAEVASREPGAFAQPNEITARKKNTRCDRFGSQSVMKLPLFWSNQYIHFSI